MAKKSNIKVVKNPAGGEWKPTVHLKYVNTELHQLWSRVVYDSKSSNPDGIRVETEWRLIPIEEVKEK